MLANRSGICIANSETGQRRCIPGPPPNQINPGDDFPNQADNFPVAWLSGIQAVASAVAWVRL
jgi:hypothetical protein